MLQSFDVVMTYRVTLDVPEDADPDKVQDAATNAAFIVQTGDHWGHTNEDGFGPVSEDPEALNLPYVATDPDVKVKVLTRVHQPHEDNWGVSGLPSPEVGDPPQI